MSIIRHAILKVRQTIPLQILQKTFAPISPSWAHSTTYNLDQQIERSVIREIVFPDCNIVGGKEENITIGDLPWNVSGNDVVIRIPKERTQGRSIVSVKEVIFAANTTMGYYSSSHLSNYNATANRNDRSAMMGALSTMISSQDNLPIVSTASVELVGENTILVRNCGYLQLTSAARVVLEYDEGLSNINVRSYNHFAKLVEYATKAKIYNDLIIRMGSGELQAGFELGIFKEIVSSYSDAQENYQTYLKGPWARVAWMSDHARYERLVKMSIGGQFK